ncbi:MAG: winged helix DNA-binding domain-containing protein [Streptosporangiaceae bacterium]
MVLTRRALNRATLSRQLLLVRSPMTAYQAVSHLVGMQAQAPNPPYVGLWTRLRDFGHADLTELMVSRAVVRIGVMRGTIHLVTDEDCLGLRPLVQPVLDRWFASSYAKRLPGVDHAELAAAARTLVEEQPRTFAELGGLLGELWPDVDAEALAQAGRAMLPLVQVPPRGLWGQSGQASHTTAEQWLGRPLAEPDPDGVVVRYLAAYGPATVKDIQTWCGLTRLKEVVQRLDVRVFRGEDGAELYDLPDAPRPGEDVEAPVRFLPEFDNLLLSYADRTRVMSAEYRKKVFTVNGIIRSTILVDGEVRGLWRLATKRGVATLVIEPFAPLGSDERDQLSVEGARLLEFAAEDAVHDLVFQ